MKRISGFDAWILAGETSTTYQHSIKVAMLSPTEEHPFSVEHVRRRLERRLHLLEPFRYRLTDVPLGMHRPLWLENCDVDMEYHVREHPAQAPGGPAELEEAISQVISVPLDRSRPLWEVHAVTGLADGRVALVHKIHHALADGMATANLLAKSVEDYPDEVLAEYEPLPCDPVPTTGQVLRWAVVDHLSQAKALPGLVKRTAAGVQRLRAQAPSAAPGSANVLKPPKVFLNGAHSTERRLATATGSLEEAREVRSALGVTLNDVVLAVAAGALRELLLEADGSADEPLVVAVPISTSQDSQRLSSNSIGIMLVSLPVHEADPVARCRAASAAATLAKEQIQLLGPELLRDWTSYLPPRLYARYSERAARRRTADHATPRLNLVVSNVPGPREPIRLAGYPVSDFYSTGPLGAGSGLNVTVWSYVDKLEWAVLVDPSLVPDPTRVSDALLNSFDALRKAALA